MLKKSLKSIKIESDDNDSQISHPTETTKVQKDKNKQENKKETKNLKREHKKSKKFKHRPIKVLKQKRLDTKKDGIKFENEFSVRIEDFESSDDSDLMNNFLIDDLDSINSENERKICIEDLESSDSIDEDFKNILKKESKDFNKINWDLKEKELLERERRKLVCKVILYINFMIL